MREPTIPQAEQAERAVLGCLLFAPSLALPTVAATGLTQGDFHNPQFRAIFAGIQDSARAGLSTDPIVLFTRLAKTGIPYSILSDLAAGIELISGTSLSSEHVSVGVRRIMAAYSLFFAPRTS